MENITGGYIANDKIAFTGEELESLGIQTFPIAPLRNRGFEEVAEIAMKHEFVKTQLPIRGDKRSAGYDFYSKETVEIKPNEAHLFWTDVKAYMKEWEYLALHVRSSIGIKKSLMLMNATGIIDSSYYSNVNNDGNIAIPLYNYGSEAVVIEEGERIAQGIFSHYFIADNDNALHEERAGGFGSSGK